jgi:hypothetical protein
MFNLNCYGTEDKQKEEYYALVTAKRRYISQVDAICKKHFRKEIKEIILLDPDKMHEFVRDYDSFDAEKKGQVCKDFEEISTIRNRSTNYLVTTCYDKMPAEARKKIYEMANTKTCPYCNRNYIDVIPHNGGKYKTTFELDHFYSKSNYPMLAISLYNLVPICPACNRIKGVKRPQFNPYNISEKLSEKMHFSYDILNAGIRNEQDIRIKINYDDEKMKLDKQIIYLQELYENHKDVVYEMICKARYQGEGYMTSLITQLEALFKNKSEIYRMIYGNYLDEKDWNKRPLSKLTFDVVAETLKAYGIEYPNS